MLVFIQKNKIITNGELFWIRLNCASRSKGFEWVGSEWLLPFWENDPVLPRYSAMIFLNIADRQRAKRVAPLAIPSNTSRLWDRPSSIYWRRRDTWIQWLYGVCGHRAWARVSFFKTLVTLPRAFCACIVNGIDRSSKRETRFFIEVDF